MGVRAGDGGCGQAELDGRVRCCPRHNRPAGLGARPSQLLPACLPACPPAGISPWQCSVLGACRRLAHLTAHPPARPLVCPQERREAPGAPWDPASGSPPLVFAGGPSATSNPEPFADFFDFLVLGDGEEVLVGIPGDSRDSATIIINIIITFCRCKQPI